MLYQLSYFRKNTESESASSPGLATVAILATPDRLSCVGSDGFEPPKA